MLSRVSLENDRLSVTVREGSTMEIQKHGITIVGGGCRSGTCCCEFYMYESRLKIPRAVARFEPILSTVRDNSRYYCWSSDDTLENIKSLFEHLSKESLYSR